MTTSFTFRDFLVYLMTGLTLLLVIGLIYSDIFLKEVALFYDNHKFIKDFSFLVTIFLIPLLYLVGHLINALDFLFLKYFVWLHKNLKKIKWLKWFLKLNEIIFYRHRIAYHAVKHFKSSISNKAFTDIEGFWTLCAKLQKDKLYENAGYWYILNDLFKAINVVFCVGFVIALLNREWTLVIVFGILILFSYLRAIQFAKFFVSSIIRLSRQ